MLSAKPISQASEICQILTCLPEKFVVDFANGIDVAKDHLNVQTARSSFFARCLDGFTGQGARRQVEINASLIESVEASLSWLTDLSESLARSNLAIANVNDRVNALKLDVARVANFSVDTRRQLEKLSARLDERFSALEDEVARIDFVQRVQLNLDSVFNRWQAGRFRSFSLSGRCFAALEELRWGAFGDYCRDPSATDRQRHIDNLINRVIAQLATDADVSVKSRIGTRDQWLVRPSGRDVVEDADNGLAFLGNCYRADVAPFVFAITQLPEDLPLELPRLSSAHRVTEAVVYEVFGETAHV